MPLREDLRTISCPICGYFLSNHSKMQIIFYASLLKLLEAKEIKIK